MSRQNAATGPMEGSIEGISDGSSLREGSLGVGAIYCSLDLGEHANQDFSRCSSFTGSGLVPSMTSTDPLIRNCSQDSVKYQHISAKGQCLSSSICQNFKLISCVPHLPRAIVGVD